MAFILTSFLFNETYGQCNAVTYATPSNNCGIDQIINVTFAGINRSSACDVYTVYTSPTPNITQGLSYSISVTTGADVEGVRAWIDYNIDGVFNNTAGTELILGPLYAGTNPATYTAMVTVPISATPGLTRLRVRCNYAGSPVDATSAQTWGEVEDYCVNILPNTPCNSTPSANSILTPTYQICPNSSAVLGLSTTYTVGGITYAWQSSTLSAVGPFSPVAGGTSPNLATPNLTTTTWFNAVITCTNTLGTTTASAGQVSVSPVITSTIPYYESFEGIGVANKLPNCSWSASNLPNTCQTYISSNTLGRIPRTGTNFASFYYTPVGANYFYTNGIYLNAGITYSASVWYETEYYGYNNWTDFSILYGTTQTTTGLVSIASTNGPAVSNIYKALANTFTVATSGLYYVAVRGTAASGSATYLTWDDLRITIPCTPTSPNTPSVVLAASANTICTGESVNLTASGADTFTWTGSGSNANSLTDMPSTTTVYSIAGTNTLTGCMNSTTQTVVVNATPVVYAISDKQTVCAGSPAHLQALGAASYTWSNGANGAYVTVNPTTPTTYTVLATSSNGCIGTTSQFVGVNQLPTVTASSNRPNEMCPTESAILTAAGTAVSYKWISNVSPVVLVGSPVNVSPSATTIYTVTGTDANGCEKSTTVSQNVVSCTGIGEQTALSGIHVYPNPTSGELSIASNNTLNKTIEVIDVTGKVISVSNSSLEVVKLNIKDLANGIYYVKIQSNNAVEVIKVVKE